IFNDDNWTKYTIHNSGLPSSFLRDVQFDEEGKKWIATRGGGVAVFKEGGAVSVENEVTVSAIEDYNLYQNYPNPFNPTTTIKYELPGESKVVLKIYDVLGIEVATLINEVQKAGYKEIKFDASDYSSGIYMYRLITGNKIFTKKMMVLK